MNLWLPAVVVLGAVVGFICVTPGPRIFEQDIILNQQAMRCFRLVSDFSAYPSWLDSVRKVTSATDPSAAIPGTEFEILFSKNYVEDNNLKAEVLDIVEGMRFSVGFDDIMHSVMNFTIKSLPKGSCKITVTMTSRKDNFISNNIVIVGRLMVTSTSSNPERSFIEVGLEYLFRQKCLDIGNLIIPTVRMSFYNWMLKSLLKLKASAH